MLGNGQIVPYREKLDTYSLIVLFEILSQVVLHLGFILT